ncbi:MAG: FAD:protein FMN transferase [Betaproteobacteria bacterium]
MESVHSCIENTGTMKFTPPSHHLQKTRVEFRAMACDNVLELFADSVTLADEAARAAVQEVKRIEAKYSRYLQDSVVSRINRAAGRAPVDIDEETSHLLAFADAGFQQSGGLFDITSGILRRAWNFKAARPPSHEEIAPLLPLIGWRRVLRTPSQVSLPLAGMELDFGGFGKEYAADRAAAVLLSHGLHHAFVNLGGDVVVTGPQANGESWQLGICHPREPQAIIASLPIASGAIATSGDYERFLEHEGRRHSHILDPRTGESVAGPRSVSVLASTCLVAGSISTIAMLKGNDAQAWLDQSGCDYLAVDAAGKIFCSRKFDSIT